MNHAQAIAEMIIGTVTITIERPIERYEEKLGRPLTDNEYGQLERQLYEYVDLCADCGWWHDRGELVIQNYELFCPQCQVNNH